MKQTAWHSSAKSGATARRKTRAESQKQATEWDEQCGPIEGICALFIEQESDCQPTAAAKGAEAKDALIPANGSQRSSSQWGEGMDCEEQDDAAARPFDLLCFCQEAYSFEELVWVRQTAYTP